MDDNKDTADLYVPYIEGYETSDELPMSENLVIKYGSKNRNFSCSLTLSNVATTVPVTTGTLMMIDEPIAELPIIVSQAIEYKADTTPGTEVVLVAAGGFPGGNTKYVHEGRKYRLV